MKKITLCLVILLVILAFTSVTMAKPKKPKHKHKKKHPHSSSENKEVMEEVFNIKKEKLKHFNNFNLEPEELSLVFYLHSVSNRPIGNKEIQFILKHKEDWSKITWYFGLPPIMFEDEIITFRHPPTSRQLFLPVEKKRYEATRRGVVEEKLEVKHNKYEYTYRNKRSKIKEKIEIKHNKYNYHYTNKRLGIKETLQVKYPSYRYTYHYKNKRTGERIKKRGRGRPLSPKIFYHKLRKRRQQEAEFHLSVRININL